MTRPRDPGAGAGRPPTEAQLVSLPLLVRPFPLTAKLLEIAQRALRKAQRRLAQIVVIVLFMEVGARAQNPDQLVVRLDDLCPPGRRREVISRSRARGIAQCFLRHWHSIDEGGEIDALPDREGEAGQQYTGVCQKVTLRFVTFCDRCVVRRKVGIELDLINQYCPSR